MSIVVKNLSHTYMEKSKIAVKAVDDVSLTVEPGEFLCIIGHTGSGKSTLIQHFNGLMQPTSGSVTVDGYDMADKKQRKLGRQLVGMVFQYPEYQLFEETVYKDVAFGPTNMGLDAEAVKNAVFEAMERVGLAIDKFCEKSPFDLSGGEKRRAALAGIIAMQPKYLVLDEPMAGLDPMGRAEILGVLESLRREKNTAVIMISHSMDDIMRHATRVAVLERGRLIRLGEPREIFKETKLIREMGLDIPQSAQIAELLRKNGVAVPPEVVAEDELVEFVLAAAGRNNGRING